MLGVFGVMFHFFKNLDRTLVKQTVKILFKPQLHCHDFGLDGATTHPDLSSRDASAWVVVAP